MLHMNMPSWLFLSLAAAFFWAIGQVLAKKGFSHISSLWNNIFANGFTLLLWVPAVLFLGNFHIIFPSLPIWGAIFATGLTYMLFFYAIAKGEVSLTGSLWALYPIATIVLSHIFLHEAITLLQFVGIILALLGGVLIALPGKKLPKSIMKDKSWILWGSIGGLLSGAGDFFAKVSSNAIGSYSQIFFLAIVFQVLSFANFLLDKKGRTLPKFSITTFLPTLLATFFAILGTLLFFLAFSYGNISLIAPVSSVYPALTVILAIIFLKEKISKRQAFGIASIVVGIILIGIKIH